MKKIFTFLMCLAMLQTAIAQDNKVIKANLNKVRLEFMLDAAGKPVYSVYYGEKPVIKPSAMGFTLANDSAFDKNFELTGSEQTSVDESWKPVWGEVSSIR